MHTNVLVNDLRTQLLAGLARYQREASETVLVTRQYNSQLRREEHAAERVVWELEEEVQQAKNALEELNRTNSSHPSRIRTLARRFRCRLSGENVAGDGSEDELTARLNDALQKLAAADMKHRQAKVAIKVFYAANGESKHLNFVREQAADIQQELDEVNRQLQEEQAWEYVEEEQVFRRRNPVERML